MKIYILKKTKKEKIGKTEKERKGGKKVIAVRVKNREKENGE